MKSMFFLTRHFYKLSFLYVILIFISGCDDQITEPTSYSAGEIVSSHTINTYSTNDTGQLLTTLQIPNKFDISYAVEVVSIVYHSSDAKGNDIQASGALLLPQNISPMPLLSIQHGTETKNDRVASVNPLNSVEGTVGILTAAIGYVTCIPDYPGFGTSHTVHPYLHAKSLSQSTIDFIIAAKSYCKKNNIALNDQLFLGGYSEGGYATLAVQKELEENYTEDFTITAVAPMAGTYDLNGLADQIFMQTTHKWPAYMAFFLYSYDNVYQFNILDDIFNVPYNSIIPSLFDGSKTFAEINNQLPDSVLSLLNQDFINKYFSGNEQAFSNALSENSLLDWTPVAPIRFFHGDADDIAPYQYSVQTMNNLIANGASDVSLVTIEGKNHETAGLPAVLGMIEWFNTLKL